MMEWRKVKLGDVLTIKYGKDHKHLADGSVPVYGSGGVMRYVDTHIYDSPSILIPRKGSLNNIFYVDKPFWTVDTMFWSIINTDIVDPYFLYCAICKYDFAGLNVGSAVPSLTVPVIEAIELSLPSLPTQRRIAAILSSLDAQIENNNRINRNLEAQAQALFKSWFVDFEPWGGVMPEGWKEVSLTNIANYLNGLAMQKFPAIKGEESLPVLKIKELGAKCIDESSDRCTSNIKSDYIVENGDVIFSWSGTLLVDIWTGGKAGLNQHLFKVTSNKYQKWFYLMWTKHHLEDFIHIAKDKAVTMGHIKRGHLEAAICNVPDKDVMKKANALFEPLVEQMINVRIQSTRLASLRDTLLPKLMKGEIEV